jgi:hypothetical protein
MFVVQNISHFPDLKGSNFGPEEIKAIRSVKIFPRNFISTLGMNLSFKEATEKRRQTFIHRPVLMDLFQSHNSQVTIHKLRGQM